MAFVTMYEYENTKLGSLEDRVYKRIERAFEHAIGFSAAEKIMARFADKTLRDISTNSYVDILSVVPVF